MLQSLQSGLSTFFSYLPQLLGAQIVLVVGFIIAYVLHRVTTKLLNRFKLDDRLKAGSGGQYVERFSPQGSPALLVGKVLFEADVAAGRERGQAQADQARNADQQTEQLIPTQTATAQTTPAPGDGRHGTDGHAVGASRV